MQIFTLGNSLVYLLLMILSVSLGYTGTNHGYHLEEKRLREEFTWSRIRYQWDVPRRNKREPYGHEITFPDQLLPPKDYIFENNIPMGANIWKNKLFVTVPRRRDGVPSTLNYVPLNSPQRHDLALIPYPNWAMNRLPDRVNSSGNAKNFVSVYRVAVDPCDRLWFIDTGLIETPGNPQQIQPTRLIIIDLKTDRILKIHRIPDDYLTAQSNLASVTLDVDGLSCGNAFAYIPDLGGYSMIVYSLIQDQSWIIRHNYFHLEPLNGEFMVGGYRFQWNDGIFSVALSGIDKYGYRTAYFHSMAGTNLYAVSTKLLRNETMATRSFHGDDFRLVGDRGPFAQTSSSNIHQPLAVLFMGMPNRNGVWCWHIGSSLFNIAQVQSDNETMIYPSDVKIHENQLIVLTNNMPIFLYGRLNYDRINFRVWIGNVYDAIKGTKCDRTTGHYH